MSARFAMAAVMTLAFSACGMSNKGFYDGVRQSRETNQTPAEQQRADQSKSYEEYENERERLLKRE